MKILMITNYFPPCQQGWGYMHECEEMADGLSDRGHTLAVLTSTYRDKVSKPEKPYPVHRSIQIDPDWHNRQPIAWQFFVGRRRRERQAIASLNHIADRWKPDIALIWNAVGLPRVLLQAAEQSLNATAVYYMAGYFPEVRDDYIAYWLRVPIRRVARRLKAPLRSIALRLLAHEGKPFDLKYENVACVSEYTRKRLVSEGLIPDRSIVIHNGVNLSMFRPSRSINADSFSHGLRCIVAGRIVSDKGIHTVIDAFSVLQSRGVDAPIHLTILGDGPAAYIDHLKQKVIENSLQWAVGFTPQVPRDQMPDILEQHNILILPSEYDEPLARSMQEGMAMNLLVIGTSTGGSGELLIHRSTGLQFETGNPLSLTDQLMIPLKQPRLAAQLSSRGHQEVVEQYDIRRTVDQFENYLVRLRNR